MKSKAIKGIVSIFIVLLTGVCVISAAVCNDDEVINLREGTWAATDVELSNGWTIGSFSFTVEYDGEYSSYYYDKYGYISVGNDVYSLTFNIDGEEIVSTSSTYYGKYLYGSEGVWQEHEFNFTGELYKTKQGNTYFDGGITLYATEEEIAAGYGNYIGSASFILEEIN